MGSIAIAGGGGGSSFPPMVDNGIVYVPGLGNNFTYTIPNGTWHVVFNGTASLSIGTITMPSAPPDGMVIRLKTMQSIFGLTIVGNAGQTVHDFPPSMSQFSYWEATYDASNTTWYIEYVQQIVATGDISFYVNPNNASNPGWGTGNDGNNGLSITTPFQTFQQAYSFICNNILWNNVGNPTIVLADGSYPTTFNCDTFPNGPAANQGFCFINCYKGTSANVTLGTIFIGPIVILQSRNSRINFLNTSGTSAINPGGGQIDFENCILNFDSTPFTSFPFFFDPGGGAITANNCTLNFTAGAASGWAGFVSYETGAPAGFSLNNCTINLPANYNIPVGGTAWLYGPDGEGSYSTLGCTFTNFGGVTGVSVNAGDIHITTDSGELSGVPGNLAPTLNATANVGDFSQSKRAFGFYTQATGFAATDIPQLTAGFRKDSLGNCYAAFNDSGAMRIKRINRQPNTQTANYVLAFTDQDGRVEMNLAGANTLTVPTNASVAFPIGTEIKITQIGAGATTITAAGGVTGNNFGALVQWQTAVIYKSAINTWTQTGA